MKKRETLILSSLFLAVLFLMAACDNTVGSKLPAMQAGGSGGGGDNRCAEDADCPADGYSLRQK